MLLQEEYFKRHSIEVPVVQYTTKNVVVFFKIENEWLILDISWEPCNYHPGKYKITYHGPNYNGNEYFIRLSESNICHWDEYEDYINLWIENLTVLGNKVEVQDTKQKCELFAWEMFLYINDGWIAKNVSLINTELLYKSTNSNFSFSERMDAYQSLMDTLCLNYDFTERFSFFKNKLKTFSMNYAFWLARICNEKIHSCTN